MCGLWGAYSSVLTGDEVKNALFLGFLSQTRGSDSTGVAILSRGKKNKLKTTIHKEVGNATNFIHSRATKQAFNVHQPSLVMGHCRAATVGAINETNAHPIAEGSIILCHNGTIGNFHDRKDDESSSDSRELARRMHSKGYIQALKEAGWGAWAVTWINYQDRTFNLARNGQRTLFYMKARSNCFYWASEYWMLNALAEREGEEKFHPIVTMPTESRFSYQLGTYRDIVTMMDVRPEPVAYGPWCRGCNNWKTACKCESVSVPLIEAALNEPRKHIFDHRPKIEAVIKKAEDNGIFRGYTYRGWLGGIKTIPKVYDRLTRGGCSNCKKSCTPREVVWWFSDNEFVCEECRELPTVKDVLTKGVEIYESKLIKTGMSE